MVDGVLEVDVGVGETVGGRGGGSGGVVVGVEGLGRKRGRDGVGRCGEAGAVMAFGRCGPGSYSSEAVFASPEVGAVVVRLGDVDSVGHAGKGHGNAGGGVVGGGSHFVRVDRSNVSLKVRGK